MRTIRTHAAMLFFSSDLTKWQITCCTARCVFKWFVGSVLTIWQVQLSISIYLSFPQSFSRLCAIIHRNVSLWVNTPISEIYQGACADETCFKYKLSQCSELFFWRYFSGLSCVSYSLTFTMLGHSEHKLKKKYLERGHICKTLPSKFVDCRLIGLGD